MITTLAGSHRLADNIFQLEEVEVSRRKFLTVYCEFGHAPLRNFCYTSGFPGVLCSVISVLNPNSKLIFKSSLNQGVPPWGLARFPLLSLCIHHGLTHAIAYRFFKAFPNTFFGRLLHAFSVLPEFNAMLSQFVQMCFLQFLSQMFLVLSPEIRAFQSIPSAVLIHSTGVVGD